MKIICKCLGGSHMYGLNGPNSDEDIRGVYALEKTSDILGLNSNKDFHYQEKENGKDVEYKEFRNAMRLLKNANTQMIELLFNDNWISCDIFWLKVQSKKYSLIDSEKLFKSLLGYASGEVKLANGERTGKLGGKRKEALEKYGFSPKNFCNLFRLLLCGATFFEDGVYPLKAKDYHLRNCHKFLTKVKNEPEAFTKEKLNDIYHILEDHMKIMFDNRSKTYIYDEEVANYLIYELYRDYSYVP